MSRTLFFVAALLLMARAFAAPPGVLVWEAEQPLDVAYKAVYESLEANRLFVVFEVDIQSNISRFAERWGENYNRNELEGIRGMVFCNGWYANEVSNQDPHLLALCPLHVTLTHKAGVTSVLFARPGHVAAGSGAEAIAKELEEMVASAIQAGLDGIGKEQKAD